MVLYKCLNGSCENNATPKSVLCENEFTTCPDCGATMKQLDLIGSRKQRRQKINKVVSFMLAFVAIICFASCGANNQSQQTSDLDRREAELQKREDSLRIVAQQLEEENAKFKQKETKEEKTSTTKEERTSTTKEERTFTTNKGTFSYERTLNHCYTMGYSNGSGARTNTLPQETYQRNLEDFESIWTSVYGVSTSTEEAREAYEASFERYKEGLNEAFYK